MNGGGLMQLAAIGRSATDDLDCYYDQFERVCGTLDSRQAPGQKHRHWQQLRSAASRHFSESAADAISQHACSRRRHAISAINRGRSCIRQRAPDVAFGGSANRSTSSATPVSSSQRRLSLKADFANAIAI